MLRINLRRNMLFRLLILASLAPVHVAAQERGTAAEAQELVARAVAYYDEVGRDSSFTAIEDASGGFVDHDLYIFVYGPERTIVAHGSDQTLVGTPADTLVDVDGIPFGDMFMDEATEIGVWVDYKWHDPVTDEDLPKSSWVVFHDGYIFGAGIYKP